MEDDSVVKVSDLEITPAEHDSPIPLYYQIETDLRRLISSGKIPAGSLMPPELELCQLYGVGRHTMRMALSRLATDDLISRRAGRGTIVKPRTDRMNFYLDRSFTQQMADMGHEAHSKVIHSATGVIDEVCPGVFHDKIGAGFYQLVRLRFGDDEPIAIQSSIILTELCPGLESYDFNQYSLYDLLAGEYHLIITEIRHTISATIAEKSQAELLKVAEGSPLLVVNTTAFLENQQVLEHTISYYRADKYEYSTTHTYSP